MKKRQRTTEFWTVLAVLNVLTLIYPFNLLLHAHSVDENLFTTLVLIVYVFLLAMVDAISIVVADAVITDKRLSKTAK